MEKFNILSKSILGILFTIIFTANVFSQSGWVQQNSGTGNSLIYVLFPTETTGYVVPYIQNWFLKTTNSGTNWLQIASLPWSSNYIDWVDADVGYTTQQWEFLYKTSNGGSNWLMINNDNFAQVSFVNAATGFMTDLLGEHEKYIEKTTDGGVNWSPLWYFSFWYGEEMFNFTGLCAVNEQAFYASCYYERMVIGPNWTRIYRTTDGGASMTYYQADTMSVSVYPSAIPSVDTAYCIARTMGLLPPDSVFYHVMKGINNSWTRVFTVPFGLGINAISFPNNNTGYIIASKQRIYKTTNGASTWSLIRNDPAHALNDLFFINGATGYAAGDGGYLIKTTTGGEELHSVSGTVRYQDNNQPVSSGYVKALHYDSQTQQITVVDSTSILPGGYYTLPFCPPISLDIMAYENDEEDAAFVPTYYVSTIYWENSTRITPDTNLTGIDIGVYRINNNAGNMHIGGTVYRSAEEDLSVLKDAIVYARIGNVFKGYSITGYPGTYCIDSLSSGTYEFIANRMGFYSAVRPLQLTNYSMDSIDFVMSILLVSVEPNGYNIPEKCWLSQNYPNPFNPQTKIKFGLPQQSYVKLTIFDVLGREVGRLINGEIKAGEYGVTWDASSLSSGIYFYRLETDKFIETRKMVLIK